MGKLDQFPVSSFFTLFSFFLSLPSSSFILCSSHFLSQLILIASSPSSPSSFSSFPCVLGFCLSFSMCDLGIEQIPVGQDGKPLLPTVGQQTELWPLLIAKGYAQSVVGVCCSARGWTCWLYNMKKRRRPWTEL